MTLREKYGATMQDPWWHICNGCGKLHVADAAKSRGVVRFGACFQCLSKPTHQTKQTKATP
jgi:hypothetical protein